MCLNYNKAETVGVDRNCRRDVKKAVYDMRHEWRNAVR